MKKSVFAAALVLTGLAYQASDAQVRFHIGVNFGTAPVYVQQQPVAVEDVQYSDNDDYYYLPDVDAYYDVADQAYCYMDGDRWVRAAYLPGRFHDFDWRYARHYEVRARRPFMHNDFYRSRFNGFAGGNPDWRMHDNRFNGNGGYAVNRGSFGSERGGFAHREGNFSGFNRQNDGYGQSFGEGRGNRNNFNPQQQGNFNHERGGNYGQAPEQNYNNRNQGDGGQGQNGQFNNNRNQGSFQNGGQQGRSYNQPSNNQGNQNRGGEGVQQHFANNNGPGYNHQNGLFRQHGGF